MKTFITYVFTILMAMHCYTSAAQNYVQKGIIRKITLLGKSDESFVLQDVRVSLQSDYILAYQ